MIKKLIQIFGMFFIFYNIKEFDEDIMHFEDPDFFMLTFDQYKIMAIPFMEQFECKI
jgi:hypothetical protein